MTTLLTYKTALEAARQPDYPILLQEWGEPSNEVPEKLPSISDLERDLREGSFLGKLSTPLHLLVSTDNNSHTSDLVIRHVTKLRPPRGAFVRLGEGLCVSSPELIAFQMARICTVHELALLISELCGTYAIDPRVPDGFLRREKPLTTLQDIRGLLLRMGTGYGTKRVRAALPLACQDSWSPMESKLALRLRLSAQDGGFEVPYRSLNEEISLRPIGEDLEERKIRIPDILILNPERPRPGDPLAFIAISLDYNGRIHLTDETAAEDDTRRNELLSHGIKPFALNKRQYDDIAGMDSVLSGILRDLRLPNEHLAWGQDLRVDLHDELELIDGTHWSGEHRNRRLHGPLEL